MVGLFWVGVYGGWVMVGLLGWVCYGLGWLVVTVGLQWFVFVCDFGGWGLGGGGVGGCGCG